MDLKFLSLNFGLALFSDLGISNDNLKNHMGCGGGGSGRGGGAGRRGVW